MFYCTLYQATSGTDRVRLCLAFNTEQEARDAENIIIQAAKTLGATIEDDNYHSYGYRRINMIGHINCLGPNSNEIFVVDNNKLEKIYYTAIETDKTLGAHRRLYHPIKNLIVDGKEFLLNCKEISEVSSADWYDELSELNK